MSKYLEDYFGGNTAGFRVCVGWLFLLVLCWFGVGFLLVGRFGLLHLEGEVYLVVLLKK